MIRNVQFEIVFFFVGEDREYVDCVVNFLCEVGVIVFYDIFEEVNFWGKNFYDYFFEIYQDKVLFIIMFILEYYLRKMWINYEWQVM